MRVKKAKKNGSGPGEDLWAMANDDIRQREPGSREPDAPPYDWETNTWHCLESKHNELLTMKHPEPDIAFSFTDWATETNHDNAGADVVSTRRSRADYEPIPTRWRGSMTSLDDDFRAQRFPVLMEVSGIELEAESPTFEGTAWHAERQPNEHIIATAIYICDVANVTKSRISLYAHKDLDSDNYYHDFWEYEDDFDALHLYRRHEDGEAHAIGDIIGWNPHQLL